MSFIQQFLPAHKAMPFVRISAPTTMPRPKKAAADRRVSFSTGISPVTETRIDELSKKLGDGVSISRGQVIDLAVASLYNQTNTETNDNQEDSK